MNKGSTIIGDSASENVIRCERVQTSGLANNVEDDCDWPNVLSCEKCDTRYALYLQRPFEKSFETLWNQRVIELRTAVTAEHDFNHPTTVLFHNGKITGKPSGKKRFGYWLRS